MNINQALRDLSAALEFPAVASPACEVLRAIKPAHTSSLRRAYLDGIHFESAQRLALQSLIDVRQVRIVGELEHTRFRYSVRRSQKIGAALEAYLCAVAKRDDPGRLTGMLAAIAADPPSAHNRNPDVFDDLAATGATSVASLVLNGFAVGTTEQFVAWLASASENDLKGAAEHDGWLARLVEMQTEVRKELADKKHYAEGPAEGKGDGASVEDVLISLGKDRRVSGTYAKTTTTAKHVFFIDGIEVYREPGMANYRQTKKPRIAPTKYKTPEIQQD